MDMKYQEQTALISLYFPLVIFVGLLQASLWCQQGGGMLLAVPRFGAVPVRATGGCKLGACTVF